MDHRSHESGTDASTVGAELHSDTAGLFHTSEIRWFAHGPLPPDVEDWFIGGRSAGSVERRLDTYQLYGINDIGVKRRYRTTLEVKVRRALGASLNLGDGLEGRVEEWSRWEPGEAGGIWQSPGKGWIGVRKMIYLRSFMPADREVMLPAVHTNRLYPGCDIEIADVNADGTDTWTLALKAFGPTAGRQQALESSWRTLQAHSPLPDNLEFAFDRACGYPEWLRLVTRTRDMPLIHTRGKPRCSSSPSVMPPWHGSHLSSPRTIEERPTIRVGRPDQRASNQHR